MKRPSTLRLVLGGLIVITLAGAMHLFGPEVARSIHGAKLWPW